MRKILKVKNYQISATAEVVEVINDIFTTSAMIEQLSSSSMSFSSSTVSTLIYIGPDNKHLRLLFVFDMIVPRNNAYDCDFNAVEISEWKGTRYEVEKFTKDIKEVKEFVMRFLALN